jgi:hypothetical protein
VLAAFFWVARDRDAKMEGPDHLAMIGVPVKDRSSIRSVATSGRGSRHESAELLLERLDHAGAPALCN